MPFTTEQFFALFAAYNQAVWPLQVAAHLAGLLALGLLLRPSRAAAVGIALVLAFFWAITGLGYHWTWFATINPVARVFGAVSTLQALALVLAPVLSPSLRFELRADTGSTLGLALLAYAMLIYPLIGWLAGHSWPAMPMFGMAPCPTTIFTIGLLLLAPWSVARWLLVIPLLWTVVGGSGAVLLSVPQDYGLIVAALVVLGVAMGRWLHAGFALHGEPA
jgi:hypothetical protein